MPLWEVENLSVSFETRRGLLRAIDRVSFSVEKGKTLGIVGESGCGKSVTNMALLGLLPATAQVTTRRVSFDGKDLSDLSEKKLREIRGSDIAIIFQNAMSSLNPSFTVGFQINEVLRRKGYKSSEALKKRGIELLDQVGIPDAKRRLHSFPHELSGGMCQRVMIAMALASEPKLLIADEPTTALDVTIQAQILELLDDLQKQYDMALVLITHDIGVVAEHADDILVMYAGQVVESGKADLILHDPQHPYTQGLLKCLPRSQSTHKVRLPTIPGMVPDLVHRTSGCQMYPRCEFAVEKCLDQEPPWLNTPEGRKVFCHMPMEEKSHA